MGQNGIAGKMFGLGVLALLLGAWGGPADDQKAAKGLTFQAANPSPISRNFRENNAKHKLLLAVVDTGVDYNHPILSQNFHFDLDQAGKPIGLGYDFVGDDVWPFYAFGSTHCENPASSSSERDGCIAGRKGVEFVLKQAPDLARFLNPYRSVDVEVARHTFHGTHVSGLTAYDRPDIGIVPFRVIPATGKNSMVQSMLNTAAAIDRAAAQGVRIINMSLGATYSLDSNEYAVFHNVTAIEEAIKRHPEVLVVASAGNETLTIDGREVFANPCGQSFPNLLCVGALKEEGDPANFTNYIARGATIVFALGNQVLSTLPMEWCDGTSFEQMLYAMDKVPSMSADKIAAGLAAVRKECGASRGLGLRSGTSMAAPIVAHYAAELLIANPRLSPEEVIQQILNNATPRTTAHGKILSLKIKKPSWYREKSDENYWEGFVASYR